MNLTVNMGHSAACGYNTKLTIVYINKIELLVNINEGEGNLYTNHNMENLCFSYLVPFL